MRLIYKIVREGKTYSFTSKRNACFMLRIPEKFTDFNLRQMKKRKIDEITIYDFKTQQEVKKQSKVVICQFCKRTMVKKEEQNYCQYCGSRLWNELTYNAMQKMFGKSQAK